MNPEVSVIIPAYNRAGLIELTLVSIASQSMPVHEIIVVDDGSSDGTSEVVSGWLAKNRTGNARLLTLTKNVGKPAAVNKALAETKGEFVAIVDSDDILLPDAVERQTAFLRVHEACGMVFGLAFEMLGETRIDRVTGGFGANEEISDVVSQIGDLILRVNPIVSSSVMFRRSAYQAVGGMLADLRYTHDWEYWIRIARRFSAGFIPVPVVCYRLDTSNSSSANRLGTFREVCSLVVRDVKRFPARVLRRAILKHVRFNASLSLKNGRMLQTLGILWEAFLSWLKLIRP